MKKLNLTLLLTVLMSMVGAKSLADGFEVDGVTYEPNSEMSVSVTGVNDNAVIEIPETVNIDGQTFTVTDIRDYALSKKTSLTTIALPNTLTSIGTGAFSGCSSLASIALPNTLTSIGTGAFSDCSSLASIDIPASVTYISEYTFLNCSSLASIDIPASVTYIGEYTFFKCSSLTSIIIPASVVRIGQSAFKNTGIFEVAPDGVFYVGNWACGIKGTVPASISLKEGTKGIADGAFPYPDLTDITIPSSLEIMGIDAFKGSGIYENAPDGVVYAGNWVCGVKGTIEGSISLNEGTVGIAQQVFSYKSKLTSISLPNSLRFMGSGFEGCSSLASINIPNSITTIDDYAFYNCSSLASIIIPNSITTIGNSAFRDCSSLASITIPNSVTTIGNKAFYNCSSLASITIPNSVTTIGESAFQGSGLTSLVIPSSSTSIGESAFSGCQNLADVTLPSNLKEIGDSWFENCSSLTSIDIPNTVTSIGNSAFSGCGLTSFDIPNSVTTIGDQAFASCSFTSLNIPNHVTSIGSGAFSNCRSLTSVILPNTMTSVSNRLFKDCSALLSVNFPNAVTSIGDQAFQYCFDLRVNIPNTVTSIGDYAFYSCLLYSPFVIPSSVTSIGKDAFRGCFFKKVVELSPTPPSMDYSFSNYYGTTLYVPTGCKAVYQKDAEWSRFEQIKEFTMYDDASTTAPAPADNVNAIVIRAINAGEWSTICLPFAMTTEQLQAEFGWDVQLKEYAGFEMNGDNISVNFTDATALEANHPYIINVTVPYTSFMVDDVVIPASTEARVSHTVGGQQLDFVGTLAGDFDFYTAAQPNTAFFLSGGKFWEASSSTQHMNAFRAYFSFTGASGSRLNMVLDGEQTTGIADSYHHNLQPDRVYDLQGRPVQKDQLKPGLYISNGKKTIIR